MDKSKVARFFGPLCRVIFICSLTETPVVKWQIYVWQLHVCVYCLYWAFSMNY